MNVVAPVTIGSIRSVAVFVSDHDRACDFYVDGLGFQKRDDTEWGAGFRVVEVAPPGSGTSLVLVRPSLGLMGAEVASWAREQIGAPTGIVFETGDIEDAHTALAARGVHFLDQPTPRSWGGCSARLADPDGNVFLLVQPDGGGSESPSPRTDRR